MLVLLGGVVASTFAVLAIVGPANHETTTISWPSSVHEMMGPAPLGSPILLAERQPESFAARIPCAALTAPSDSTEDYRVLLSTARKPGPIGALVVAAIGDEVRVLLGTRTMATTTVDPSEPCEIHLSAVDADWSLAVGGLAVARWEAAGPIMSGLYTDVPPSTAGMAAPRVSLTTYAQTSSPSRVQWIWTAAALISSILVLGAIVRLDRRPDDGQGGRWRGFRLPPIRLTDLPVFSFVAIWGVLAGPQSDDGWVMATVAGQRPSGSFGNYYDAMNANLNLGYLHDLLFHVLGVVSDSLLWFRIPVVLAWCVVWYLTRTLFDRWSSVADMPPTTLRWARWTLSTVFVLSIASVGISIRPEFLTGLAALVVALIADRFRRRPSTGSVVAMAVMIAVAVSIHTVGVICLAPAIVVAPSISRWLRLDHSGGLLRVAGGGLAAAAVGMLLVFADTDTRLYRHSLDLTALTNVHNSGPLSEWKRYGMLFDVGWGLTSLRLFVVVATIASVGTIGRSLLRRRRREPGDLRMEFALWWVVGAALLAAVPSKWPLHFAALTAYGSLATAGAVVQLASARVSKGVRPPRRLVCAGALTVVLAGLFYVVYVFRVSPDLWVNDSTALSWIVRGQRFVARATAVVGIVGVGWYARFTVRRNAWVTRRWRCVAIGAPSVLALGVTVSVVGAAGAALAAPSGWSMGRQNLGLTGSCGLASRLDVADPDDLTDLPLLSFADVATGLEPVTLPNGYQGWRDPVGVANHAGQFEAPWQRLDDSRFLGIWMAGQWWSDHETTLVLEFGRARGDDVDAVEKIRYRPFRSAYAAPDRWRLFVAQVPPLAADSVRVVVDDDEGRTGWMGVSVAVGLGTRPLDDLLTTGDRTFLIDVISAPFMPCARRPTIIRGVVELPDHVIEPEFRNGVGLTTFGRSPFFMQTDAFEVPFDILPTAFSSAPDSEYPGALVVTRRPDELALFDPAGLDLP